MKTASPQKKRVVLYGILLSAIHFSIVGFCLAIPALLMNPDDMRHEPDRTPTRPRYPVGEALQDVGDMLRVPFDWMWTNWMSHHMPDAVGIALMVLSSCLWGFGLALVLRFLFSYLRSR